MKSRSPQKTSLAHAVRSFLREGSLAFGFLIATTATVGSLFFSEILKFPPCDLCWYQRIFMYPQVVLFGIALWKNDYGVKKYNLVLSLIGLTIALYHVMLQLYPTVLPCTSQSVSCATKQVSYFGFITIPVMSAAAFLAIIILMWIPKSEK